MLLFHLHTGTKPNRKWRLVTALVWPGFSIALQKDWLGKGVAGFGKRQPVVHILEMVAVGITMELLGHVVSDEDMAAGTGKDCHGKGLADSAKHCGAL